MAERKKFKNRERVPNPHEPVIACFMSVRGGFYQAAPSTNGVLDVDLMALCRFIDSAAFGDTVQARFAEVDVDGAGYVDAIDVWTLLGRMHQEMKLVFPKMAPPSKEDAMELAETFGDGTGVPVCVHVCMKV